MINDPFRPWGDIRWLMPKFGVREWHVIGALATEERCLSVLHHHGHSFAAPQALLLTIIDPPSQYAADCAERVERNREKWARLVRNDQFATFDLFTRLPGLKSRIAAYVQQSNGRIVLDVSALPKRFFFPILRWLIQSADVTDLVVTYSAPVGYHSGELAFEPGEWAHIPTFQRIETPPIRRVEKVIVGVGFIPFGLPGLLRDNHSDADVVLMFPFPPGAPQVQRNWRFVSEIEQISQLPDDRSIRRVDVNDMPACYGEIEAATGEGEQKTVLAPYGPKPHSVAMCLFAIVHDCDVFYTQPKFYHPDYSMGIAMRDGLPVGSCYLVKTEGQTLYS